MRPGGGEPGGVPQRSHRDPGLGNFNIGYTVFLNLIYTSSHTCRNAQLPPAIP
jgi:hypothetical protein